jgi:hypothetical protein
MSILCAKEDSFGFFFAVESKGHGVSRQGETRKMYRGSGGKEVGVLAAIWIAGLLARSDDNVCNTMQAMIVPKVQKSQQQKRPQNDESSKKKTGHTD